MKWRFTCPHGDTTIKRRGTGHDSKPYYYCEACRSAGREWKHGYKIDQKTGEKITA